MGGGETVCREGGLPRAESKEVISERRSLPAPQGRRRSLKGIYRPQPPGGDGSRGGGAHGTGQLEPGGNG